MKGTHIALIGLGGLAVIYGVVKIASGSEGGSIPGSHVPPSLETYQFKQPWAARVARELNKRATNITDEDVREAREAQAGVKGYAFLLGTTEGQPLVTPHTRPMAEVVAAVMPMNDLFIYVPGGYTEKGAVLPNVMDFVLVRAEGDLADATWKPIY